jgi:hypothetical protein
MKGNLKVEEWRAQEPCTMGRIGRHIVVIGSMISSMVKVCCTMSAQWNLKGCLTMRILMGSIIIGLDMKVQSAFILGQFLRDNKSGLGKLVLSNGDYF